MTEKENAIRTLKEQLKVAKQALLAYDENHEEMTKKYGFKSDSVQKYEIGRKTYLDAIARLHNDLEIAKR